MPLPYKLYIIIIYIIIFIIYILQCMYRPMYCSLRLSVSDAELELCADCIVSAAVPKNRERRQRRQSDFKSGGRGSESTKFRFFEEFRFFSGNFTNNFDF